MTTSRCDGSRVIRIAAAVVTDAAGRTLLVRKRGTAAYMQPGGKIGAGESAPEALAREIREELGCELAGESRSLGLCSAPAANEPGCTVEAELFAVSILGEIRPAAEIEDALWIDPAGPGLELAPLTRDHVLPMLRAVAAGDGGA